MPDDGRDDIASCDVLLLSRSIMIVMDDEPLPIPCLTSLSCSSQLTNFTCVPHYDRIDEERPVEGVKPTLLVSPHRT